MYSTYSFLFQLYLRKKSLWKLSELQRAHLFFVVGDQFKGRLNGGKVNKRVFSQKQFKLLGVKVYRSSVRITEDCVGLPLTVYCGNKWYSIMVNKCMVGFSLKCFI